MAHTIRSQRALALALALSVPAWLATGARAAHAYDPLSPLHETTEARDFDVRDEARARTIPIRVHLARDAERAPIVLFSHGLGGSREGSAYLGRHWAARGYAAVFVQHPGSDEGVWKDADRADRMRAMRRAASRENLSLRVADVPAVLDQLERWSGGASDHPLRGRLDPRSVGMSGHSFGAVTTQAVGGQRFGVRGARFTDPRIRAAIAMSPSAPRRGSAEHAFGAVAIPWLLATGTRDTAPIGGQTVESRRAVFPALPPGAKYELVLDGAEHAAFTDRALLGGRGARHPNHHRAILAVSTAFWDAFLQGDAEARAWLDGAGPRGVLEPGDRWQRK